MFYAVQNWECQASLPNTALDFNVTAIEIDLLVQLTTNRRQPHGEDYPTCLCNSYGYFVALLGEFSCTSVDFAFVVYRELPI